LVKEVIMPRLDVDMDRGMVIEWAKGEGDEVREGELVATVMSEKVTYEVYSPATGTIHKIIVQPNVEVPVGQVICIIREPGDSEDALEEAVRKAEEALTRMEVKEAGVEAAPAPAEAVVREAPAEGRIKISPLARRLAREHGVDISRVRGTGPGGRIVARDVLRALEEEAELIPLSGVRKITAERLAQSFRTAPHAFLQINVDMQNLVEMRDALEERLGVKPSYNALLVKAVAKALREHPLLNSTLEGDKIRIFREVNVCIAVATEAGLVTPVVRNADAKSVAEIERDIRDLVARAREGKLKPEDLKGGTFTITNLGMFGIDSFLAIINPPQAAILSVGRIADRPVVVDGRVVARPTATLTLSFDHRVVDGAPAAKFLNRLRELIEEPTQLLQ